VKRGEDPISPQPGERALEMHERRRSNRTGKRRSTLTLQVGGGQKLKVMTHEQIVRKQLKMARNRHRRHSFTYGAPLQGSMIMLHELRQFYDVSYRVFLVKAQL